MRDAILIEDLGKRFNRYHAAKPITFMEAALTSFRKIQSVDEFWALRGVSFSVAPGEMLGVIGHNGAGKSTLLQLLGKVAYPTEGRIKMRGRVGALLDLGAGFHGDLTGRENVFVSAIVAGLPRQEVTRRFDQIVAFAELEGFIDNPVRTYSSGMMMRLAFSVAVHTDPEILLVDEFLSVGDLSFQSKCLNRIAEMKEQGCAIVLVSHDVGQVERLCDRALWLKQGTVAACGEPTVVAGQYTTEMRSQSQQRTPQRPPQLTRMGTELRVNENRFGSQEIEIVDVRLQSTSPLISGGPLCIEIEYHANQPIDSAVFSVGISQENGTSCMDVNTADMNVPIEVLKGRQTIRLWCDRLDLGTGKYFVNVGIFKQDWAYAYDYHWHVYPLTVLSEVHSKGILAPPLRWELVSQMVAS
ncbi:MULTISPECIES: ABC transporter ATP-binding protein [unclassified Leptolyngbya]|uniref:ABC transporter ATP-binding protein n=1 Tax=unclassified Leptolyngbya TaxID=2650499 RepID=UPI0016884598|nr:MULTISPECIES: ABC transporter ATP-binding protein [unclassified Leptolyngbya]MBD1913101.1 ABC transporter ATP-binding protein [Leptolyngbya sp. FACHB-8]MBD2153237.1 ABC transporter ATP-binding protein [Leptolyngbya sp. FACHB-16]